MPPRPDTPRDPHTEIPPEILVLCATIFGSLALAWFVVRVGAGWTAAAAIAAAWAFRSARRKERDAVPLEPRGDRPVTPGSWSTWRLGTLARHGRCVPVLAHAEWASQWLRFAFAQWALPSVLAVLVIVFALWPSTPVEAGSTHTRTAWLTAFATPGGTGPGSVRRQALHELLANRVDLRGTDLEGWDLRGLPFARVSLDDADLASVRAQDAKLSGASLRRAVLHGAALAGAALDGADLRHAELANANLAGADLRGARLEHADLTAAMLAAAVLRDADLSHADLSGADLRGTDLTGAILSHARLDEARLDADDLIGARWRTDTVSLSHELAGALVERTLDHAESGWRVVK